jgi:predicted ATP-grasp superfamily ATP-dependent carboligase
MSLHCNCFIPSSSLDISPRSRSGIVGKSIYYAPFRVTFPQSGPWDQDLASPFSLWRLPGFADIPEPLTIIEAGSPVLTIFAEADSAPECRKRLQSGAEKLDRLLLECSS